MENNSLLKPKSSFRKPKHRPLQEEVSVCTSRCSRSSTATVKPFFTQPACPELLLFTLFYTLNSFFVQIAVVFLISHVISIEKRFTLDDHFSTFVIRCVEISYVCAVIFMTHFLRRCHLPRTLLISAIINGFATIFVCVIYMTNPDRGLIKGASNLTRTKVSYLCNPTNLTISEACSVDSISSIHEDVRPELEWLLIGCIMLLGVTMSCRLPLSSVYIETNIPDKYNSAFYIGISMLPCFLSVPLSLVFTPIFADIPQNLSGISSSETSDTEIEWWLGYIVLGVSTMVTSLPLLYFPPKLNSIETRRLILPQYTFQQTATTYIKELPVSIYRIITCPVYVLVLMGMCFINMSYYGFLFYSPPYLMTQFQLASHTATMTQGTTRCISATIGVLLGGYLISGYKFNIRECIRLILVLYPVSTALNAFTTLFGCFGPSIQGYHNSTNQLDYQQLPGCYCSESLFLPTCGDDGRSYYSPCVAGCRNMSETGFIKCNTGVLGTARLGLCGDECTYIYPYIGAQMLADIFTAMLILPSYIILMRSIGDEDKPLALAIMTFFITLLGFIAAPVLFGYVINTTCLIWSNICTGDGECLLYDLTNQRVRLKLLELGVSILGVLFFIWGYLVFETQEERIAHVLKETKKKRVNSVHGEKHKHKPGLTHL
ncbi:solute carrier organic anion transporter family member 2A1 [Patella vulgata]|uniref:solute carrier organic anion transporter family member 2A1 n=1 Tax=Patella vulgata TaxID=6465 RepID=UPI002180857D|nr:solute carrier organic anion transporter family member 2A1 [Patella vulgata]